MAQVRIVDDSITLDEPFLIDGLPGIGLVGKIATDHIIQTLGMTHYASARCESIPPVTMFEQGTYDLKPPVRIFASEKHNLLALRSDVMFLPDQAKDFVACMMGWIADQGAIPLMISGLPDEDQKPEIFGVATGAAGTILEEHDISAPVGSGAISGPTGAFLHHATEHDMDAVGLVVETDPQFPDPNASKVVIENGITPITGVDVQTARLDQEAETIRRQKEQLAQLIQEMGHHERGQAYPENMYG